MLYLNGDRLDCRRANLYPLAEATARGITAPAPAVTPGSTFCHLPEFHVALEDRTARAEELAAQYGPGRPSTLNSEQVRTILAEFADPASRKLLDGRSYQWLVENFVLHTVGKRIKPVTLRAILRGDQQRQPGFDYKAIRKFLPWDRKDRQLRRLRHVLGLPGGVAA